MLHICAVGIVEHLIKHSAISEDRKPVYVYGAELTLSTLAGCLSILLISLILQNLLSGLLFLAIFISLRLFGGGYHAETYATCFLISNCIYLLSMGLAYILERMECSVLTIGLLLAAMLITYVLSPIRNSRHPLSERAYQRNNKIAKSLVLLEGASALFVYFVNRDMSFLSIVAASFTAVAVMMIYPVITERRK